MQPTTNTRVSVSFLDPSNLDTICDSVLYIILEGSTHLQTTPASHAEGQSNGGKRYVNRSNVLGSRRKQQVEAFSKVGINHHVRRRRNGWLLHQFNRRLESLCWLVQEHRQEGFAEVGATRGDPMRYHARWAKVASGSSKRRERREALSVRCLSSYDCYVMPCEANGGWR